MLRGCLTVLLVIGGAFAVGVGLGGDPCDREGVGEWFVYAGLLLLGGAAFVIARALTPRVWMAWAITVAISLVLWFGLTVFAVLRWVGACAN